MLHDLFAALGLMLVLEGVLPFLNPRGLRKTLLLLTQVEDRVLRFLGLACMITGVLVLYVIR